MAFASGQQQRCGDRVFIEMTVIHSSPGERFDDTVLGEKPNYFWEGDSKNIVND